MGPNGPYKQSCNFGSIQEAPRAGTKSFKQIETHVHSKLTSWGPVTMLEMCAQPKMVVKIESEDDMLVLQERAKSLALPIHITIDAGRTQIAQNSRTVMAILGPVEVVDEVTGGLKLL